MVPFCTTDSPVTNSLKLILPSWKRGTHTTHTTHDAPGVRVACGSGFREGAHLVVVKSGEILFNDERIRDTNCVETRLEFLSKRARR
jgi:hypothetical protein